jgi:hypothetical protein
VFTARYGRVFKNFKLIFVYVGPCHFPDGQSAVSDNGSPRSFRIQSVCAVALPLVGLRIFLRSFVRLIPRMGHSLLYTHVTCSGRKTGRRMITLPQG